MRLLPLLCVALLAAGCYDSRFGERGDDATPEPVTATIRQLREKFAGTTFPVTGDIVVSGRVTTSDYDENFYRTFCIEEDGAVKCTPNIGRISICLDGMSSVLYRAHVV